MKKKPNKMLKQENTKQVKKQAESCFTLLNYHYEMVFLFFVASFTSNLAVFSICFFY